MERYEVHIENTREAYRCAADRTLLGGMEALARKGIPVGCRGGGCGVCKVRIESGSVRAEKMSREHVTVEEQAQGYVLACRACESRSSHATASRCSQSAVQSGAT